MQTHTLLKQLFFVSLLSYLPIYSYAETWDLAGLGIRGASDIDSDDDFEETSLVAGFKMPYNKQFSGGTNMFTRLETSIGVLKDSEESGAIITAGPAFFFKHPDSIIAYDLGISLALLSENDYKDEDLGGQVHFLSHVTFSVFPADNFSIGYRLQHLSNAGLSDPNPGLDMHAIEIAFYY